MGVVGLWSCYGNDLRQQFFLSSLLLFCSRVQQMEDVVSCRVGGSTLLRFIYRKILCLCLLVPRSLRLSIHSFFFSPLSLSARVFANGKRKERGKEKDGKLLLDVCTSLLLGAQEKKRGSNIYQEQDRRAV